MTIAAVVASDVRLEVYRVTAGGGVEHRWLDASADVGTWTEWQRSPFDRVAQAVSAISGWGKQIEVFVLDIEGEVWNRWWWKDRGWLPVAGYNRLGRPFVGDAHQISAVNTGSGHFNLFVEAVDGRLAMLPHVNGPDGPYWRRCPYLDALNDGWWPAFSPISNETYRQSGTRRDPEGFLG